MKAKIFGMITLFCVCLIGGPGLTQNKSIDPSDTGGKNSTKYGYYYKGKMITLNLSKQLIAIEEKGVSLNAFVQKNNLTRDSLSNHESLIKHSMGLYRLPVVIDKTAKQLDLSTQIRSWVQTSNQIIQPVFEQGPALLIPSDEVIIGFKKDVTLDEARIYLTPHMGNEDIIELSPHRRNTYLLKISNPAGGRVYGVCQFLSKLDEVWFAEPNHIIVIQHKSSVLWPTRNNNLKLNRQLDQSSNPGSLVDLSFQNVSTLSAVGWTILIDESFEGTSLPPGWSTGRFGQAVQASWSVTNYRSHSDSKSCYATGEWTDGVPPPGPYPNNAHSWLDTPLLNLASYEEVYIEFWFYAKYENPGPSIYYDFGELGIYNPSTGTTTLFRPWLNVPYTGDLTTDPTTDNGWRKALFRIPPSLRIDGVMVEFIFKSDISITREGLYIDQVRVIATTDVDTEPLGNDTYSARQYELKNAGQIAGLGDDSNDLHMPEAWNIVSVSSDVVVAVIDDGVDLAHADLNLVTGYDYDGSVGGGPKGSDDNHGTAVAGNIGAVRNNSIGVIGTAPGVKIMPIYKGTTLANFAAAIDVAVAEGADILSNSWGWVDAPSTDITNAINDALTSGRIVIFAAGNGPDRPPWTYQTAFPCELTGSTDLICVGATSPTDEHKAAASSDGKFWWGSSYIGDGPDVCAPGPWSYTTDRTGSQGYNDGSSIDPGDPDSADYEHDFGGTSSSTPKVSGIAALLLSVDPFLTPADVKRILRDTADDIDVAGIDDKTGAGRVNAYETVAYLLREPRATTNSATSVSSFSATLNGTVNPNDSPTDYYFEYGLTPSYGSTTTVNSAGAGTTDVQVSAVITISDPLATYHFRLVATNSFGTTYGQDVTFTNDTDADLMPDDWEINYFGDLSRDGTQDFDGDLLDDLPEYQAGTDPTNTDTDNDDLPDGWEVTHGIDPLDDTEDNGRNGDFDHDGWTNYEELDNGTNPNNNNSPVPTPPVVMESNPHQDAGIVDSTRVPNDCSFAVRVNDTDGIDITDISSIEFTIDDGDHLVYMRDLNDSNVVRVIKLTADADTAVTELWAVYDRSRETAGPYNGIYSFEAEVSVTVDVKDMRDDPATPQTFAFKIETQTEHDDAVNNMPVRGAVDPLDPDLVPPYNAGWKVNSGDLTGAKILYNSNEPVAPDFGPLNELQGVTATAVSPVGIPMNLQPPTVFNTPVKVFIPCPGYTDVSGLTVYIHNGTGWVPGCACNGDVLTGGKGCIKEGTRINHNVGSTPLIELQLYHFTGVQAANVTSTPAPAPSGGGGGGGCFIATAAFGSPMEAHVKILREFRNRDLLETAVGKAFVESYYTYSPPVDSFIAKKNSVRTVVRWCLLPLVGFSWLALKAGFVAAISFVLLAIVVMFASTAIAMKLRRLKHLK